MNNPSHSISSVAADSSDHDLPSLTQVIAIRSLLVMSVGMFAYAAIEYGITTPTNPSAFILDHVLHVVVVALAVWLVCWATFEYVVRLPIQTLYLQLYKIGSGRLENLSLKSPTREMQMLVSGINLLAARLDEKAPATVLTDASRHVREIRGLVRAIPNLDADRSATIMRAISQLEEECFRAAHDGK